MDTIRGRVVNTVDGDTFDMVVTRIGKNNQYRYNDSERVRIASIDAPELSSKGGQRSRQVLQKKLHGKEVRCHVQARDEYERIVAQVQVLKAGTH